MLKIVTVSRGLLSTSKYSYNAALLLISSEANLLLLQYNFVNAVHPLKLRVVKSLELQYNPVNTVHPLTSSEANLLLSQFNTINAVHPLTSSEANLLL